MDLANAGDPGKNQKSDQDPHSSLHKTWVLNEEGARRPHARRLHPLPPRTGSFRTGFSCRRDQDTGCDPEADGIKAERVVARAPRLAGWPQPASFDQLLEAEYESGGRLRGVSHLVNILASESEVRRVVYQSSIFRPERQMFDQNIVHSSPIGEDANRLPLRATDTTEGVAGGVKH